MRSSWRACLQGLVSGDYLTPAFVGLAFRDNLSPPNPISGGSLFFSDDRAALIERGVGAPLRPRCSAANSRTFSARFMADVLAPPSRSRMRACAPVRLHLGT